MNAPRVSGATMIKAYGLNKTDRAISPHHDWTSERVTEPDAVSQGIRPALRRSSFRSLIHQR